MRLVEQHCIDRNDARYAVITDERCTSAYHPSLWLLHDRGRVRTRRDTSRCRPFSHGGGRYWRQQFGGSNFKQTWFHTTPC